MILFMPAAVRRGYGIDLTGQNLKGSLAHVRLVSAEDLVDPCAGIFYLEFSINGPEHQELSLASHTLSGKGEISDREPDSFHGKAGNSPACLCFLISFVLPVR